MFKKYIKIEFYGHSPERFLNLCRNKQISIWDLDSGTSKYSCYMYAKDFKKIKVLAHKAMVHVNIKEKHGISFLLFRYRRRKIFLLGMGLAFAMIFFLSRFIWNIEVDGNQSISDDIIYDYLKEKNIRYGMRRAEVDCEKICKELRVDFYKIIWVSASLEGTSLKIDIREGKDAQSEDEIKDEKRDIIAQTDGVVTSMITRTGVAKVKIGDTVKKGDVLVSGVIEIRNDAGEIVSEEVKQADADIWIKSSLSYENTCNNSYIQKKYYKTKKYRLLLNNESFQLELGVRKNSGNQERFLQYHHFSLPVKIAVETSREYEIEEKKYSNEEKLKILEEEYSLYCKELKEQGIQIVHEEIKLQDLGEGMCLQSSLEVIQQVVDLY